MPFRSSTEWGPTLWAYLHTISVVDFEGFAQERMAENAMKAVKGALKTIPCSHCAEHFATHVVAVLEADREKWLPPMALFRFMVEYHNTVNRKVEKPEITYEAALARWAKVV